MKEPSSSLVDRVSPLLDIVLENSSKSVRLLWAKTGDEKSSMNLVQHLADTAVSAAWLWDYWVSSSLKETLSRLTGLSMEDVGRLFVFLSAVHDIGKGTVDFQTLIMNTSEHRYLVGRLRDGGIDIDSVLPLVEDHAFPHNELSGIILKGWLKSRGMKSSRATALCSVVDAHHGRPSDPMTLSPAAQRLKYHPAQWHQFHEELLDAFAEAVEVIEVLQKLAKEQPFAGDAAMLLTGLVIMADWIASNADAFGYETGLSQEERLERAVSRLDLTSPWTFRQLPKDLDAYFQEAFGWSANFSVRPVQRAAVEAARMVEATREPSLFVVEAPTGEGKTEAGLSIAEIVGKATGAQGAFFAAPTMSTSNGLFDRAAHWANRVSASSSVSSLFLAHSKNLLMKSFADLRFNSIAPEVKGGTVVASQWLSGRKKGVLSNFVVGTVDQVLMMALQMKHVMLRHVGLAGKIIIIDEVHAYDAYMSSYLRKTLAWFARYGATVILMSATLPPTVRKKLVASYFEEVSDSVEELEKLENQRSYPLISVANRSGIETLEVEPRDSDFSAKIEVISDDPTVAQDVLNEQLELGGVALIICNTVRRAQELYGQLENQFPGEVELHHAAFVAAHRAEKEERLRGELGPNCSRGHGRPLRKIVVATQVAEQSLDIDADLLITDLAPIDSIIQRAGRLHRHERPAAERPGSLSTPQIYVRGILETAPAPSFDKGTAAIYDPLVLLATFFNLPDSYNRPSDIEALVRHTYALAESQEQGADQVPPEWRAAWLDAVSKSRAQLQVAESRAKDFQLKDPRYADKLIGLFDTLLSDSEEKGNAQVRDAEMTLEVIVIEGTAYGYRAFGSEKTPIADLGDVDYQDAKELAANTLRLPVRMTRRQVDFDAVIDDAEKQTPRSWLSSPMLKGQVALELDADGHGQLGNFEVEYNRKTGLVVKKMT
ncbi:CRISPR-associated helicase Cas3' [Corynebacterium flavescens]|uniref:CRISPR-associated helicase Cas3' n=1 Tax=Corynebacterium flavescens TaxID=28028 RepID=UPI003FD65F66